MDHPVARHCDSVAAAVMWGEGYAPLGQYFSRLLGVPISL